MVVNMIKGYVDKAKTSVMVIVALVIVSFVLGILSVFMGTAGIALVGLNVLLGFVELLVWVYLGFELAKAGLQLVECIKGSAILGFVIGILSGVLGAVGILIGATAGGAASGESMGMAASAGIGILGAIFALIISPIVGAIMAAVLGAIGGIVKIYVMK